MSHLASQSFELVNKKLPAIGETVRVSTFAGNHLVGLIISVDREGYHLKHPSRDGLRALVSIVPAHWYFSPAKLTVEEIAANRYWVSYARYQQEGTVFRGWDAYGAFAETWGDQGITAFLSQAYQTAGPSHDFKSCLKRVKDRKCLELLRTHAKHHAVRDAAQDILAAN